MPKHAFPVPKECIPVKWIIALNQLPPRWQYVWVHDSAYGRYFAYRTIFGNWKTKSGFSFPIFPFDKWAYSEWFHGKGSN